MSVYLDYAATTPTRPEVIDLITEVLRSQWGNPSSLHNWGERSTMAVERSRFMVADLINADPEGIIFTSGGTESNNLALWGITQQYDKPQHLIISAVEHSAIAQPAKVLSQMGWSVTELPVDQTGRVNPSDLIKEIQPNTVLVSVIFAQNEIGTIQPIAELGKICRDAKVLFHTDAVQAIGRIDVNLQVLPVDLLTISAHKIYGGQGVGALYVRPNLQLIPLILGGGQERGIRSGTESVAAIAGFGLAAELAKSEIATEMPRLRALSDQLFRELEDIPNLIPTGAKNELRLPNHVSFCHSSIDGRHIVRAMNATGIGISAGSACSSGSLIPSSTLLAMGFSHSQALGAIRLSLGLRTRSLDIEQAILSLKKALEISPSFKLN
ncbi:cysteine desulfurase family protein [Synechococcus sp. PCC 7502]|uniref:cysteine desulfurase family protein n=1 Tax=Synechococcus sp. PCC 7502 TaxID=1173263 RepID=UPI00029F8407|nr:cysteine desulfurase family protein [Synechococcus sp. PCC 7502]AFY75153.1 cysteine desulfurase family protein [Synechococcus sp. PCC 7502]